MTNVDVLGGFLAAADGAGGYDFSTRNMTLHETIIAHDGAVTVGAVGLRGNVLFEGFTVRGSMSNISFNFFVADCKTGFEVRSNQIIGGDATSVLANEAYALYVVNSGDAVGSGPLFRRNTIQGGERSATSTGGANKSYGAYLSATNAIFEANTIAAGTSDDSYAVYVTGVEAPILKSNVILSAGKTAIDLGTCHALYVKGENNVYPQVVISNNTVHARVCNDPVAATAQTSVAMTLDKTMAVITGNLFLGDGSAFAGAATSICVDVLPQTAPWMATFHSNTLAGCNADGAAAGDFAFRRYFGGSYGEATSLDQACQTTRNFFGTAGPTGANTYVATLAGMGFVNIGSGDYHLTGSSPAIVRSGSPYTLTNVCGATWSGNEALCTATTNPATNTFTCGSVTYDRDMVTRSPSYSRGAYEF